HFRHHVAPLAARRAHCRLQECGSVRGIPVRLRRQCRHRGGDSHLRRSHHQRRAQPCQHHRWLSSFARQNPCVPSQGRGGGGKNPRRARVRHGPPAPDHGRRVFHGRRYRPPASVSCIGRK